MTIQTKAIWHCVFCGRHWEGGPPTVEIPWHDGDGKEVIKRIQVCPFCREYKGLEICHPETCDCWDIRCVPEIIDILRDFAQQAKESMTLSDQELAKIAMRIVEAMTPPKERYEDA